MNEYMNTLSQEVYDRQKMDYAIKGLEGIITDASDFVSDHRFNLSDLSSDKLQYIISETNEYSDQLLSEIRKIDDYEIKNSYKINPEIIDFTIDKIHSRISEAKDLFHEYSINSEFKDKSDIIPFNYDLAMNNIDEKLKNLNNDDLVPLLKLDIATEVLEIIERSNSSLYELMENVDEYVNSTTSNSSNRSISNYR